MDNVNRLKLITPCVLITDVNLQQQNDKYNRGTVLLLYGGQVSAAL
jgi:hypothetical protein